MHFSRLRLTGFKSFVDPTELHIEPGLTAVVGPNGCGKSNLLEGIRWVMGENAPKSMRASGMDDVIFAGTDKRPPRNLAEVTLIIDNANRGAPAAFNSEDVLEVSRRIERESGSAYRINGRDVRAKDVQLLFADAATGAHSPALVSQGRVGALINAKPRDRRAILEEAAGVSGLHTRRKEAESRLRAAEANLVRLHDVLAQMEAHIASLKRQARQATRYRNISGDIRRAEATLLYIKWRAAAEDVTRLESALRAAEAEVAELTRQAAAVTGEQATLAAELPALRDDEAKAAATVQRLTLARDSLEAEEQRRRAAAEQLAQRLEQIATDEAREAEIREDAAAALARLDKERDRLAAEQTAQQDRTEAARETLSQTTREAAEAEAAFDGLNRQAAGARARRESLEADLAALDRRLERLRADDARLAEEAAKLADATGQGDAAPMEQALAQAEERLGEAEAAVDQAAAAAEVARGDRDGARDALAARRGEVKGLEAEQAALRTVLASGRDGSAPPVAEALTVSPGYETALGAALGDDLEAPEGGDAPLRWVALPPLDDAPGLPDGAEPLAAQVKAPDALARRLAQVGVVADIATGQRLAGALRPGQRLVTREGALWRWDGFVADADAPTPAAVRLAQRNRLDELDAALAAAGQTVEEAAADLDRAETAASAAHEDERTARAARTQSEQALSQARRGLAEVEAERSRRASKLTAIEDARTRVSRDLDEAVKGQEAARAELADLPEIDALDRELATARQAAEERRAALAKARATFDGLEREAEMRTDRLAQIVTERGAWALRVDSAASQLDALKARAEEARRELETLKADPDAVEAKRQALLDQLADAEQARAAAADRLAQAENGLADKDRALKAAQDALQTAREKRIRSEAAVENAADRRRELAATIGERFECAPADVLGKTGVKDSEDALPELASVETRLERFKRERERLGAVNLRADEELKEIEEQVGQLIDERADLEAAIARLRQAINGLNKEGRERLLAAFDEVNRHFGDLFKALFGGGEAHLKLTESDDPLEAGLEIFASPPGKRLQHLSLLSGGEQALTALSLIFAVFMTNPAPICVLDEVDAPLDDANVERFCDLLDEMERRTDTRFLIITHNAVTMSRVHRLFGVTMAERGISQLVSVDLERAEQLKAVG